MPLLRRLIALLVFVAAFVATSRASATVIKDGERYSVDLGRAPARICWVSPLALRDASDCEGLTPEAVPVPPDDQARIVAMGLVRLEQPGELPDLALVMVMHVAMPFIHEPDAKVARDYAEGAQKAVAKELPPGARMRPVTDSRVVKPGKHPLIRSVLEADGIPDTADSALLQHQIHVAVLATDGLYSVTWMSRHRDAKTIDAYADATAASVTVSNPAMTKEELGHVMGLAILGVIAFMGVMIGGIVWFVVSRKPKQAQAPFAYPYPYDGRPSSSPPPWHPAWTPPIPPPARAPRPWWDSP